MTQPKKKLVYGFEDIKPVKNLSHESWWSVVKEPDTTYSMCSIRLEIWLYGSVAPNLHAETSVTNHLWPECQQSKKFKAFLNKSWRLGGGTERCDSILTMTFDKTSAAELSALRAGGNLTPNKFLGSHFSYRLSGHQGYWMRTEGTGNLKSFKARTRNQTRKLPLGGAVKWQSSDQT